MFDTNMISNAYNLVKAGLLEKPLEFGFVMGANAQGAFTPCTFFYFGSSAIC